MRNGRWREVGHMHIRKAEDANFKPNFSFFTSLATAEAHLSEVKFIGLYGTVDFIAIWDFSIKGNQGQYSVSKQPRHTQGSSQLNSIRHSVTKTGTAQHGQAQRNKDRHSLTKTATAQHGQAQRNKDRHSPTQTGTA